MDGHAAIERNRVALKRIVASLMDMAGLAGNAPLTSPLRGGRREASGGGRYGTNTPTRRSDDRRPPLKGEVKAGHPTTLPRHLYLFILRLLRPAEAAARRLIIAAAKGLTVPPPKLPRRPETEPKPQSMVPYMRKMGLAISPAFLAKNEPARSKGAGGKARAKGEARADLSAGRSLSLPLFDPPRRLFLNGGRRRTVPPHAAPRICVPGFSEPHRLPPPPSPEDPISAARLSQRIAALAAALDDLPGQARRFARWRARCDVADAQEREFAASGGNKALPLAASAAHGRSGADARPAGGSPAGTRTPPARPGTPREDDHPATSARWTRSWRMPMRSPSTRWNTPIPHEAGGANTPRRSSISASHTAQNPGVARMPRGPKSLRG